MDKNVLLDLLGPSYARREQFWKAIIFSSTLQGLILPCFALGFVNLYVALSEATWLQGDYKDALNSNVSVDPLLLGHGEWWYISQLAGSGLAVGILKVVWTWMLPKHEFHERIPGFIEHVRDLKEHDPLRSLAILVASALSIGLGVSCGPELALGTVGTAFGTVLGRRWGRGKRQARPFQPTPAPPANNEEEAHEPVVEEGTTETTTTTSCLSYILPDFSSVEEQEQCALDGMSAVFATVFPSSILGPILVMELGGHWGPGGKFWIIESLTRMGVAATFSYGLYTSVEDYTLIKSFTFSVAPYEGIKTVDAKDLAYGAILGVASGIVGIFGFLSIAIFGKIGDKISDRLNGLGVELGLADHVLGKLLTPAIGGILLGLIAVAAPLTLGDGSQQIGSLFVSADELGTTTIAVSGLLKIICVSIGLGFGFVGGPIFPLIFAGAAMGSTVHRLIPDIPALVSGPVCLVAVPMAFIPALLFFTMLASLTFVLGGAATSPVFIGCICSYTTICGMGLIQDLVARKISEESNNATVLPVTPADVDPSEEGLPEEAETLSIPNGGTQPVPTGKPAVFVP